MPPQARRGPPRPAPTIEEIRRAVYARAYRDPAQAPIILGQAADRYARAASDPRNRPWAQKLHGLAQEFAQAQQQQLGAVDDFDEVLEESIDSHQAGAPDDLQLVAVRQQLAEAQSAPVRMTIAPESWSRNTALGRYSMFKYAPSAEEHRLGIRQEDTLVIWPGLKHEAQAFTADFSLANLADFPPVPDDPATEPTLVARPYGFIEYGSDGAKTRVLFDIGFGTRVTVAGNYIAAGAGMSAPPDADPDDPDLEIENMQLRIGCSLGAFAAPSVSPVTFTGYVDRLDNAGLSTPIQRPVKATFLLPLVSDIGAGSTNINFLDFNCKILYTVTWPGGTIAAAPIPLSPDVAYVRLLNNTGSRASYRVVFQLAL